MVIAPKISKFRKQFSDKLSVDWGKKIGIVVFFR
jgi:hypothetical protein